MAKNKIDRHRWGLIYCPRLGSLSPRKRWREIREYLKEKHVEYDCIQSEDYSSLERQAKMLADNGYETIVVVGGDGALQDVINGIMASENYSKVSLGIIPNGIANDYASYWRLSAKDYKAAVDCIITHRVRKVDVGCCSFAGENGEQRRYFLNVLNIGLTARVVEIANQKRFLFAKLGSIVRGLFQLLFFRQSYKMRFKLNNQLVDKNFMMLCVGNSRGYGMTPSAVPYNGWLDVSAIKMSKFFGMIEGLIMVYRRKIMNYELMEPFRTTEINIEDVGEAHVGIDGRMFYPSFPMKVTIIPEAINLIIPTKIMQTGKKRGAV